MNVGTRRKTVTTGLATLPYVNLLPTEIIERRVLRKVQAGLGGVVVLALAVVAALYLLAVSAVTVADRDLTSAKAQHASAQQQLGGLANVGATYALVDKAHGLLRDAGGSEVLWSTYLTDLSLRIPDNVWLTTVTIAPGPAATPTAGAGATPVLPGIATISFAGVALSHDAVAGWLDSIAKERGWTDPYFTASTEQFIGSRQTYLFTSTVTVTAAALSGRYTAIGGK